MGTQVTVSVSTGVMNPLLSKLAVLLREEHAKLKSGERGEVTSLKGELSSMSAVLRESAMMEEPDVQVTEWMRQVREVTYDAEDCVDLFQHRGCKPKQNLIGRILTNPTSSGLSFADQIGKLKNRLIEANERRDRYKLAVAASKASDAAAADSGPSSVTIDQKLIDMQHATPVAIDSPTKELLEHLTTVGKENHAKVVSIVGMAGIGKTTLAMQVSRRARLERFDCQAFAYVGRRPSVRTVLVGIISKISPHQDHNKEMTEHDAINQLRKLLEDKRYLIILDDIFSISAWNAISCALPQNSLGSRIVVTTRINDVARSCCSYPSDFIYVMKTLGDSDSKRLFHRRLFGSEEICSEQCSNVHDSVLKVCSGLPLIILVVASFLARTAEPEKWDKIYNSTLSALEQYPLVQVVKKMLHISYTSLPFDVKSCFLYLSVFPKNCKVDKDRLIWRWIAEGFIPGSGEESTWATGRSYFNELINRSLIKPGLEDDDEDGPTGCVVEGAIHDFIVSLSSEENFVTLDEELESSPRDAVRRLSLNYTKQEEAGTNLELNTGSMNLNQARSLTVLGRSQRMPPLSSFRSLRVLDLEDAEGLELRSLEDIGRLFNLRYLGLGGETINELPEAIGDLQLLETLEMRRTKVRKLAARLQKLVRLRAQALDEMPDGVLQMQGLQEVSTVRMSRPQSLKSIAELIKLEQLRILGVKWSFKDDLQGAAINGYRNEFVSSLNKVCNSNISSLSIHSDDGCSLGFLADSWDPPYQLQKLVMIADASSKLPRIPSNLAKCIHLTYLEIAINIGSDKDVLIISKLPVLTILKLSASGEPIVINSGFQRLKVFWFHRLQGGLKLVFEKGAMPLLRKLRLCFKLHSLQQHGSSFSIGLQHLYCLKQIHTIINCDSVKVAEVMTAEDAIRDEAQMHDNPPDVELSRENEEKMIQDGGQGSK